MKQYYFHGQLSRYLHLEQIVHAPCDCMISKFDPKFNVGRSSMQHVLQLHNTPWMNGQEAYFQKNTHEEKMKAVRDLKRDNMPIEFIKYMISMGHPLKSFPCQCPAHHRVEDALPKGTSVKKGERLFRHGITAVDLKLPEPLTYYLEPGQPVLVRIRDWPGATRGPKQVMQGKFVGFYDLEPYDPFPAQGKPIGPDYTTRLAIESCPNYPLDIYITARFDFPMLSEDYRYPGEPLPRTVG